ncbi:hypothetical protein T11_11773 [Trichinella zimbabwensis]|uniref:Uncharacterized protein n=1 Tax=Trichinella zimbabwensis TaxID=268475 RepID=A0A0V1H9J8_9BILA|nr:hypothetical protein T11_11773 [Trichinella zimbabwensis]
MQFSVQIYCNKSDCAQRLNCGVFNENSDQQQHEKKMDLNEEMTAI